MSQRQEFVSFATQEGANISELCRRFGVSRKTGYKWFSRFKVEGPEGLQDRSRRPHRSPSRTSSCVESTVLSVRDQRPAWGGRKIRRWLDNHGESGVPAPSTITAILKRHGRLDPDESSAHMPYRRFEYPSPNMLWQMDFKGDFPVASSRCHPFTVLDDHSRFAVALQACENEQTETVQAHLTASFRTYGLPDRILADNGAPWAGMRPGDLTALSIWLIRLGVRLIHGRPYHPQTQGKDERFHRTIQAEVISRQSWTHLDECRKAFDQWRDDYNFERPHEALDLDVPADRYRPSSRAFPETLPPVEYDSNLQTRKVQEKGEVHFRGRIFRVGRALRGQTVAFRNTTKDGLYNVYYCQQPIATIDLTDPSN